jgi:hypothetical protein
LKKVSVWRWVVAAAIATAGAVFLLSAIDHPSDPKALVPPSGDIWGQDTLCHVGETQYAGFSGFNPVGRSQIHFTGASLTGVPGSISIRGVYAVSFAANPKYAPIISIAGESYWSRYYKGIRLAPVSDAVLDPTNADAQWWMVVEFVQTVHVPRAVRTSGLRIDYRVGSAAGTTVFPYEVVSDCS